MRTSRPGRPAFACRVSTFVAVVLFVARAVSAATLSGRVVDLQGAAVTTAHVVVTTVLGSIADRRVDAEGRFNVSSLGAGTYDVRAFADGFQSDAVGVMLGPDDTKSIEITLHISAIAEALVVSASTVDLPLSRAGDTVSVLTAADLQTRQIETVSDALRLVPALGVTRSGGRGAITSLFPRGGASNYTLVLVDGVRVNSFGGSYDFGHLAVGDIDRIEVVRGPQSALFGGDAIGAVVQIVTRRGGPPRVESLVEGGSQSTARVTANASGSTGGWRFGAGVEQRRSAGYTGIARATGERVTNDDDHLRHASGSLGWQNSAGTDFLVAGNLSRDERGFPGPFGSNPTGEFRAVDRVSRGVNNARHLGGRLNHPWTDRIRQRFDLSVFDLSSDFTSAFATSASGTRRVDGRIQEDMAFNGSLGASAGVELVRERGSSTFITGLTTDPLPIRRGVIGTFGEVRYVGGERLFITGGARVERLARDAVEANTGTFTSRPAFPEQTIDSFNPKISASYTAGSFRVHASAGTGIRPPTAFEIAFTDNPNLKPERNRSLDAGIEQRLARDRMAVGATAFFNRYDDLLITVGRSLVNASRYRTDNISNARARGLEVTADARPLMRLTMRAHYTFLDTEILSVDGLPQFAPPPFRVGDPLVRRPRHQAGLDIAYSRDRVSVFVDAGARSRVLDVEPTFGASGGLFFAAGYGVANAGVSVRVTRNLDLTARVSNIGDREYEEALGFPALRRSAIVGVRLAAGR
jgi:outer membrane cobalamin receptor